MKFIFKWVALFLNLFPRIWVRRAGSILGWLWFDVFRIRRKIVLENLRIAFPEKTFEERTRMARKSMLILGGNFFELFLVPVMDLEWVKENVIFHGDEHLKAAQESGKGFYLLGMHLGNGDAIASSLVVAGTPLQLITKVFKNKFVNDVWFSIRGAQGVEFINAHGKQTAFEILKGLKNKKAVVFVLDQYMGKPYGIETCFFGKKTGTAYGLALFYQKSPAPILPVYAYQGEDQKMHLCVDAPLRLDELLTQDLEQNNLLLTQAFCDKIEEIVKRHPEEWMWLHRRWKEYR